MRRTLQNKIRKAQVRRALQHKARKQVQKIPALQQKTRRIPAQRTLQRKVRRVQVRKARPSNRRQAKKQIH